MSATDATFTFAADVSFAVDDIIEIIAPAAIDATHDGIAWTLEANLTGPQFVASEVLQTISVNRAFTLPEDLVGSSGESVTAPAASVSYPIHKNGSPIGTIDFALGVNTATFTFAADISFVADDLIEILAPATLDTTHNQIAWSLASSLDGPLFIGDEVLQLISVNRAMKLVQDLVGSTAECKVVSTGSVSYVIKKNGSNIGTIDFALGVTQATFTFAAEVSFIVGDFIEIVAPATIDATHDTIGWTLAGELVI
jgi:hypothetical protein